MKANHAKEKIEMIRELLKELEAMNGWDGDETHQKEAKKPPTDLVGKRVRVISKKHKNKLGTVTKRRGELFWWITTDDGKEFYRKHTMLEVIDDDNYK